MLTLLTINKWDGRGDRCEDYECFSTGLITSAFLASLDVCHYELHCGKLLPPEPFANPRLNLVLTEQPHNHLVLSRVLGHGVPPTVALRRVPHPSLTAEVARLERVSNG